MTSIEQARKEKRDDRVNFVTHLSKEDISPHFSTRDDDRELYVEATTYAIMRGEKYKNHVRLFSHRHQERSERKLRGIKRFFHGKFFSFVSDSTSSDCLSERNKKKYVYDIILTQN